MEESIFEESAKLYIENYPHRLKEFLNEFEATESDFIAKEIDFWYDCQLELESIYPTERVYTPHGLSTGVFDLQRVCGEIGSEKIYYSILSKLRFLEEQKKGENKNKVRLKINEIALIYAYDEKQITRENGAEIAALYGYNNKTSGEGLYQDFTYFVDRSNRVCLTKTNKTTIQNRIKKLEGIIKHIITNRGKAKIEDEIKILTAKLTD